MPSFSLLAQFSLLLLLFIFVPDCLCSNCPKNMTLPRFNLTIYKCGRKYHNFAEGYDLKEDNQIRILWKADRSYTMHFVRMNPVDDKVNITMLVDQSCKMTDFDKFPLYGCTVVDKKENNTKHNPPKECINTKNGKKCFFFICEFNGFCLNDVSGARLYRTTFIKPGPASPCKKWAAYIDGAAFLDSKNKSSHLIEPIGCLEQLGALGMESTTSTSPVDNSTMETANGTTTDTTMDINGGTTTDINVDTTTGTNDNTLPLPLTWMIGIGVGLLILAIVVMVVLLKVCKRKKEAAPDEPIDTEENLHSEDTDEKEPSDRDTLEPSDRDAVEPSDRDAVETSVEEGTVEAPVDGDVLNANEHGTTEEGDHSEAGVEMPPSLAEGAADDDPETHK